MSDPTDTNTDTAARDRAVEIARAFLGSQKHELLDAREERPEFWVVIFEHELARRFDPGLIIVEVNVRTGQARLFPTL